jgi:hypothetical protein
VQFLVSFLFDLVSVSFDLVSVSLTVAFDFGWQHGCNFWHWELEYVGYIVDNDVLLGDSAVDAIGWAEDRREALELIKAENEAMGEGPAARVQRQHDQKMHQVVKNMQALVDAVKKVQLLLMIIACILSVMLAMTVMKKN